MRKGDESTVAHWVHGKVEASQRRHDTSSEASEAGDERSSKTAQDFIKLIESRRSYYATIAARKEDAIDYYRPYPPIQ